MFKQISLTQGQFAVVDARNYKWLSQYKWCADWNKDTQSFYAVRMSKKVNGKQYMISMTREILGLHKKDKQQVDHINHNTLNNCESNLRIVNREQNQWNRRNTKGYHWHKIAKKYQAQITANGTQIYLGYFDTPKETRNAYLKAKKLYHRI